MAVAPQLFIRPEFRPSPVVGNDFGRSYISSPACHRPIDDFFCKRNEKHSEKCREKPLGEKLGHEKGRSEKGHHEKFAPEKASLEKHGEDKGHHEKHHREKFAPEKAGEGKGEIEKLSLEKRGEKDYEILLQGEGARVGAPSERFFV